MPSPIPVDIEWLHTICPTNWNKFDNGIYKDVDHLGDVQHYEITNTNSEQFIFRVDQSPLFIIASRAMAIDIIDIVEQSIIAEQRNVF